MTTCCPDDLEWVDVNGDVATIGATARAAEHLGDVAHIERKEAGDRFEKFDGIGVIKPIRFRGPTLKTASQHYAPVAGEIIETNGHCAGEPTKLNEAPEGAARTFSSGF